MGGSQRILTAASKTGEIKKGSDMEHLIEDSGEISVAAVATSRSLPLGERSSSRMCKTCTNLRMRLLEPLKLVMVGMIINGHMSRANALKNTTLCQ